MMIMYYGNVSLNKLNNLPLNISLAVLLLFYLFFERLTHIMRFIVCKMIYKQIICSPTRLRLRLVQMPCTRTIIIYASNSFYVYKYIYRVIANRNNHFIHLVKQYYNYLLLIFYSICVHVSRI